MNYEEMSLVELKAAAKEMGLKKTAAMRKSDLLTLLILEEEKKQKRKEKFVPEEKAVSKPDIILEQKAAGQTGVSVQEKKIAGISDQEQKLGQELSDQKKVSGNGQTAVESKAEPVSASISEQKGLSEKVVVRRTTEGRTYYNNKENNFRTNTNRENNSNYNNGGRENSNSYNKDGGRENNNGYNARENSNGYNNRENGGNREGGDRQPRQFQNGNTQRRMQDTGKKPAFSVENREGLVNAGRMEDGTLIQVKSQEELAQLDSGIVASGVLEVMTDGFGFIRSNNYMPGDNDVYVSPAQIRKLNLKTGDIVVGNLRVRNQNEKFAALLYVKSINGMNPEDATRRPNFEELTPIFPNERLHMATDTKNVSMRIVDMMSPVGKGQRGMIVAPPKAGKTTLLKEIAKSITKNHRDVYLIILLIDERPEEVTDIKESIEGPNVEVVYSTFDELPEHHKRVSEMVLERAKRLVEYKQDVVILLDSITRLARAYNLVVPPSGRTLSGGLDPAALHMPKRFFGAARNMREGGSLTVLATALIETGSKMDDVIYEEFKGTGNMELTLNRKLQEKRIFPAIDILKSSTRRDDLLLTAQEQEAMEVIRKATSGMRAEEAVEQIIDMFARTRDNIEFVQQVKRMRL